MYHWISWQATPESRTPLTWRAISRGGISSGLGLASISNYLVDAPAIRQLL
jgi:hypothetical protein